MGNIIYLCTYGEYSDYSIHAVFDNIEMATIFCKKYNYDIEEWVLNEMAERVNFINNGYDMYRVRMDYDGNTIHINECGDVSVVNEIVFGLNGDMYLYCWAKSENHAIKIANEKRIQLIATNNWGNSGIAL